MLSTWPPMRLRGCASGLCGSAKAMTQDAPKGAMSSGTRARSPAALQSRMARKPPMPGRKKPNRRAMVKGTVAVEAETGAEADADADVDVDAEAMCSEVDIGFHSSFLIVVPMLS
ncbi:hypothetical protein [Bacillus sp. 3255]|uniref:hypothetical protein n=1 Tax=Bacillus sp. 3255 TaxID=2817904 RepID=UPI0028554E67|nr:hypothetical protein [Bacillus sp. 3255]MDR6884580.1 hypothetical protein [Bacillus sp. 3255]